MADVGSFRPRIGASESPGDGALAALATRQHGVVAYRQLVELGFGRRAIQSRVAQGRLHRVHLAVYAVGHSALNANGRLMAAVLACGPGAVLSHRSAAALWGLLASSRSAIDVTGARSRHPPRGVALHRVRQLAAQDWTVRDGMPVTTVARTLLDLAEVERPRRLRRAIEEAERLRLFDLREIEELHERSRGRKGLRPLRTVLSDAVDDEPPATRSELERRFVSLCREAGLPPPAVNVFVAGLEVDALWPNERLVVELDGHAFHRTRAAFERDRVRDAALQLARYRVVRLTHRRLTREPAAVAETLRALLVAPARVS